MEIPVDPSKIDREVFARKCIEFWMRELQIRDEVSAINTHLSKVPDELKTIVTFAYLKVVMFKGNFYEQ